MEKSQELQNQLSVKNAYKRYCIDKVNPYTDLRPSSASGSNIIGILILHIGLSTHKFKQNFIICRHLKRPLVLDLYHTGTSWDSGGKHFLHKDGKPIVYTRIHK